jgi:hypothetical protein
MNKFFITFIASLVLTSITQSVTSSWVDYPTPEQWEKFRRDHKEQQAFMKRHRDRMNAIDKEINSLMSGIV